MTRTALMGTALLAIGMLAACQSDLVPRHEVERSVGYVQ